ncbi:MAG: type II secretion system protein [Elusimicrobia bacterium]|nr:type II secretion system protein [Elusimicrobiota bacterium]
MLRRRHLRRARGFTLVELMIVVAIIGILTAIAVPKFGSLLRKAHEGAAKGNLGLIRSALIIYYSDMEGQYPSVLGALTVNGRYLTVLPSAEAPGWHPLSSAINYGTVLSDSGGWQYNNTPGSPTLGTVLVNCTHTDTKGSVWTAY